MSSLASIVASIPVPNHAAMERARQRQTELTKPPGSLGRLEELSVLLAGIRGEAAPSFAHRAVIVMAADHGVAAAGVSAYPAEVTPQMVLNFLHGGAAINVLARHAGARVAVVDVGVAADIPAHPHLYSRKIAPGTANFATGPAMTREQAVQSLEVGIEVLEIELARGLDLVATGDMGIGNTSAASAIVAALLGLDPVEVTGRGTGLDDAGLRHKVAVIAGALALHQPNPRAPLDVLAQVGGFEIGAIAGMILAAARHRVPVIVDGFISAAGALIAHALAPAVTPYLIAGHHSVEIGHRAVLAHLGLVPLLDLNLRLGEGTGAALAMHLVEAATRVLAEMATFAEAGVAGGATAAEQAGAALEAPSP